MSGSMFDYLLQSSGWEALLASHGRLATAADAVQLGATSATLAAVDAVWEEDNLAPVFEEDGKHQLRTGTLKVLPSSASGCDSTWEALIDGEAWYVERIESKSPHLVLAMRRRTVLRDGGGNTWRGTR